MVSLSHPKTLYFSRIAQLAFAIGFLILLSWCGVHRAWWTNINGAIAVGVIAFVFTLAITLYTLVTSHVALNPFRNTTTLKTLLFLVVEALTFLLWIATTILMLRHKDGCDEKKGQKGKWNDKDACYPKGGQGHDGTHFLPGEAPKWQWDLGVAFAIVEAVSFLLTAFLVWREEKGRSGSGGASYA